MVCSGSGIVQVITLEGRGNLSEKWWGQLDKFPVAVGNIASIACITCRSVMHHMAIATTATAVPRHLPRDTPAGVYDVDKKVDKTCGVHTQRENLNVGTGYRVDRR